ncbi:calmodulin binding protein PICBP-like [Cornus florida]|uniref:calmodulin binding protein PICBP-like n=1 Tax=Cornus florida TaxID=4283 RepID=UPI002896F1B2|nr:calmodulin binding protein PICBP-like [Cornus florida]XP_059651948.1 calmodulin binding protein PICBP-like [Cornus florida]
MVQRKVPNKLSIQLDHVKSDKRLGNLKSPSSQHQDGKNRGADLKKRMKKSRSIKRSEFESLLSPALRQQVPQPGKPPPPDVPKAAAVQQKQSPTKALHGSPNYMKSTSSFEARKEHIQVSSRNSPAGSDNKKSSRKNSSISKLSSASGHKPGRTLSRTSSLKLVRTLTKTPSFKPARSSTKKCSQVVLCENLKAQRATCSSTLKNSMFPNYLTLGPGATDSEGTSVMKVCPYTYCSLNGHHHTPLPPLKCFLAAKRRMLKTQKSIKLGCLSPRRTKPSGARMKEIDTRQVILDEKPAIEELDLNSSEINPLIQEPMDFFIEIYVEDKEDASDANDEYKHDGDDQDMIDISVGEITPSVGGSDETVAGHEDGQVVESLPDESLHSEIDFDDHLGGNSDVISTEMDIAGSFAEDDQNAEAAEEVCSLSSAQEETSSECSSNQSDLEVESPASLGLNEPDAEASDMEWEEGPDSAPYIDNEVDISIQTNNISDMEKGYSWEVDNANFLDEPDFKSDDILSSYFEEFPADEVLQENVNIEGWFSDGGSESDGSFQDLERDESVQVSNNQNHDQISFCVYAIEEFTATEGRDGKTESDGFVGIAITSATVEKPTEQRTADEENHGDSEADDGIPIMVLELEDDETKCASSNEDEALTDHQENLTFQNEDATVLLGYQQSDSSIDFTERDQDETYDEYTESQNSTEVNPFGAAIEKEGCCEKVFDGSFFKTEDSEIDQNCQEQKFQMVDEQLDAAKSLGDLLGFVEADQDTTMEGDDENQLHAIAKDGESNQGFVDEGLPAETQEHSSDERSQSNNTVENQDHPEKDQDAAEKFKSSRSMDSQGHTHSGMNKLRSAENSNEGVAKMEVEERTESDAENTCLRAKNVAAMETKNELFHSGNNHDQELPNTCKNPRGTISRCKRANEDCEDPRDFNPREPNYLPMEPDAEAEKVDLRHQMMDERKNSEEWMVDYALRQTVTKLAPARKRKVALLVEAFEAVMPIPKYESRLRHTSAAFTNVRPIQACS